jgi:hypothetical protein
MTSNPESPRDTRNTDLSRHIHGAVPIRTDYFIGLDLGQARWMRFLELLPGDIGLRREAAGGAPRHAAKFGSQNQIQEVDWEV